MLDSDVWLRAIINPNGDTNAAADLLVFLVNIVVRRDAVAHPYRSI